MRTLRNSTRCPFGRHGPADRAVELQGLELLVAREGVVEETDLAAIVKFSQYYSRPRCLGVGLSCLLAASEFRSRKKTMMLEKELARSGHFLFRWRGYLPILLTLPMLAAMLGLKGSNPPHVPHEGWALFSMAISFCGLGIRMGTVGFAPGGTSGRNTRRQRAAVLNTTGMYSIVRHPLYLGNAIIWLGVSMFCQTWWLTVIFVLVFWIYYERIMMAEEEFLRDEFGDAYQDWASRTPAFIPAFSQWRRPDLPFSPRTVLRREYSGFFAIVACFFLLESTRHAIVDGQLVFEPHWATIFLGGLLVYATLRTLKKRTRLLIVEGR